MPLARHRWMALGGLALLLAPLGVCRADFAFRQTNLVSSVSGLAPVTDANLKNPWGLASAPKGPFWVANQATGTSTVYDGTGQPFPASNPLVVTVPTIGGGQGTPTGLVFNPTGDFQQAPFIFATLDGMISSWNGGAATVLQADNSVSANYTGLAMGNNGTANFLYAANHLAGKIDVFDGNFKGTSLSGNFTDPNLSGGFTPYNIQNLGGTLYVTFENEANGGGIIDAFDTNGNLLRRFTANGAGGPLDSPWGLALAPSSFGPFGGALLVGNEGDGHINAFDPMSGKLLGQLLDPKGRPIANPGLWGLAFGSGGLGGDPNTLYFAAGIQGEREGLFGSIRSVPEPSSALLLALGGLASFAVLGRVRPRVMDVARRPADGDGGGRRRANDAAPRAPWCCPGS